MAYKYKYTTGPFSLPQNSHSLDWAALNNSGAEQIIRVTVFKCSLGAVKTAEPPGPLEISIGAGQTIHNANNAVTGFFYEIQVECNSQFIFPYVSAWQLNGNEPIAGSVINAAAFIRKMS